MKRKKKNDIERVTGRNRPQKTVKSRALEGGEFGLRSRTKEREKSRLGELHGPRLDRWKLGAIQRRAPGKLSCFGSFEAWDILGTTEFGTGCPRMAEVAHHSELDKGGAPLCKGTRYHTRYTPLASRNT